MGHVPSSWSIEYQQTEQRFIETTVLWCCKGVEECIITISEVQTQDPG